MIQRYCPKLYARGLLGCKAKRESPQLGILGLVYELLSYERAIMASGSEWIKAIVVRDFVIFQYSAHI